MNKVSGSCGSWPDTGLWVFSNNQIKVTNNVKTLYLLIEYLQSATNNSPGARCSDTQYKYIDIVQSGALEPALTTTYKTVAQTTFYKII